MPDGGAVARSTAEALLAELARRGTRRIWGVPGGGSSLDLIAGMGRYGIGFVLARHRLDALVPVRPAAMAGRQVIEWTRTTPTRWAS